MPELPEVEITRRGIEPHIVDKTVSAVVTRVSKLRWPFPSRLAAKLCGHKIHSVTRRGKYLLLTSKNGTLIIHLGMSGSLRVLDISVPAQKHDHFDLVFTDKLLRLHDPRKFGAVLWVKGDPYRHSLLATLGPEPLNDKQLTPEYLYTMACNRRVSVKEFIMNTKIVVGVGNIYASEALFISGIHPRRAAGNISLQRYELLVAAIRSVLTDALARGGTTLRDFTREDGRPGYFRQQLKVYGRTNKPCVKCKQTLRSIKIGQRTSTYCPRCQR